MLSNSSTTTDLIGWWQVRNSNMMRRLIKTWAREVSFQKIFEYTWITYLYIVLYQWASSRDWSRLFVVSGRQEKFIQSLYLEFYDFNHESKDLIPSSKRINLLSQLLRPSKIIKIGGFGGKRPIFLIDVSFTGDRIVIAYGEASYYKLIIYDFNPDLTIAGEARKELYYSSSGNIESI